MELKWYYHEEKQKDSDETEILNTFNLINIDSSVVSSRDKGEPKLFISNNEYLIFILQTLSEKFILKHDHFFFFFFFFFVA